MDVATSRRERTSGSRTLIPILVATAIDIAFAAIPVVQLARAAPALRAVLWPDSIGRASLALVPGVFALAALLRRSRLAVDAAIVLNVLVLLFAARSEFVVIPLVPVILLLFGRSCIGDDDGERRARIAVGIAVGLSAIAAVLFVTAPMRHALWSTQTRAGRVVESNVRVQDSCPQSLGEVIAPANDGGASGCDPVALASRAEIAIALWGIGVVIGVGGLIRRRAP